MSAFFPTLAKALASGAAFESGKELARRNGLGFLQMEGGDDGGSDYANFGFDYNYSDPWDYGFDFFSGGGWPDLSFDPYAYQSSTPGISASGNEYRYGQDCFERSDGTIVCDEFNPFPVELPDPFAPFQLPNFTDYRTITGDLDYRPNIWDWLTNLGPGPAPLDPQYGPAGTGQGLPKPCYGATYHPYPIGHPQQDLCIPYPPNDPTAKKQASQQQKAQQAAANAAKKAQQQQDKTCPKHPQGLPVWKNPATGKCEVVPQCSQGTKFDSTTRRCLTPAQAKDLYGNDYTWVWWILGAFGAALVLRGFADSGSSSSPRRRRK